MQYNFRTFESLIKDQRLSIKVHIRVCVFCRYYFVPFFLPTETKNDEKAIIKKVHPLIFSSRNAAKESLDEDVDEVARELSSSSLGWY